MTARAMILCAGLGTRLRPLTDELPKPLVPVGDRPILAHIAERLRRAGIGEAVINTHHLADAFEPVLARIDLEIRAVHEPAIRGTAGGVAGARRWLGPAPVLVWNGDILCDPPIVDLLSRAGDGIGLCVAPRPHGEGTVGLGREGQVVRLRGESFGEEVTGGDYVGVAAIGGRCLAGLPETGCLVGDVALVELRCGGRVQTSATELTWTDTGDLSSYLEANLDWLEKFSNHDRQAFVGSGVSVAPGASLDRCVVGDGARVIGTGTLSRCVVWPGATAEAPLRGAVVTRRGVVRSERREQLDGRGEVVAVQ